MIYANLCIATSKHSYLAHAASWISLIPPLIPSSQQLCSWLSSWPDNTAACYFSISLKLTLCAHNIKETGSVWTSKSIGTRMASWVLTFRMKTNATVLWIWVLDQQYQVWFIAPAFTHLQERCWGSCVIVEVRVWFPWWWWWCYADIAMVLWGSTLQYVMCVHISPGS